MKPLSGLNNHSFKNIYIDFLQNFLNLKSLDNWKLCYFQILKILKNMTKDVLNSLPNDKVFDLNKLKAFADNKINMTLTQKLALGSEENIVGKGENAGYQNWDCVW